MVSPELRVPTPILCLCREETSVFSSNGFTACQKLKWCIRTWADKGSFDPDLTSLYPPNQGMCTLWNEFYRELHFDYEWSCCILSIKLLAWNQQVSPRPCYSSCVCIIRIDRMQTSFFIVHHKWGIWNQITHNATSSIISLFQFFWIKFFYYHATAYILLHFWMETIKVQSY